MRIRPPSVRARLTLWHAGVLTLIVCVFSAGILLFVQARLYAGLDAQLRREIATISKIYREEPDELRDLTRSGALHCSKWKTAALAIRARHGNGKDYRVRCKEAIRRRRCLGRRQRVVAIASRVLLNRPTW